MANNLGTNFYIYTYNEENQIYTLILTIVKVYIFACKYAKKKTT